MVSAAGELGLTLVVDYELKSHLKFPILSCNLCKQAERCASNNLSRDNENLLLVAAFYTPISSFWERPYSH